ncbi:MAG: hypothetical protein K9L32_06630 [Chromatiaceae bacterium]|nr:hypothetical protein [Chromatiaceae bacterium]
MEKTMTPTEINEADEIHQHVKATFASIAADETLSADQRDSAKDVLNKIASLELALVEMMARGESLPDETTTEH